jgi:UDP-N-acetylmuramate dehydrogenase
LAHNTFGIEAKAARYVEFASQSALIDFLGDGFRGKALVIGGGSNLLFVDDFDGTVFHSAIMDIDVVDETVDDVLLRVGSGVNWDKLVAYTVDKGWSGLENLSLIPGTVGAAPVQNIGAYGAEAKDVIERVHYFDVEDRKHHTLGNAECHFAYRESVFKHQLKGRAIITSVEFRLLKSSQPSLGYGDLAKEVEARGGATLKNIREAVCAIRQSKLPDTAVLGNAGSFFKNPIVNKEISERLKGEYENMPVYPVSEQTCKLAAGWLIDQAGLKGYRQGNVGVHERQALVLVNFGGATGADVIALSEMVRQKVNEKFGIKIDPEVNIL